MKKLIVILTALSMSFWSPVGFAQPAAMAPVVAQMGPTTQVGVVAAVTGRVELEKSGRVGNLVESGTQVYQGDVIKTDAKSTIQLMLMDETIFTIGPESSMKIDEYEFNPKTDVGKISAEMLEGTVKFITGRIPQKKPEKMQIKLPTGVMGVRGTIGYLKVKDGKSTGILGGPGSDHNTPHRIGKIVMENKDGSGNLKRTYVTKPGNASSIDGPGLPPSASFTFPKVEFENLKGGLTKVGDPVQKNPANNAGKPQVKVGPESGDKQGKEATKFAGQNKAKGFKHLKNTQSVGKINKGSDKLVSNEGSEAGNQIVIANGRTKLDDLLSVPGGIFHYSKTGVTLTGAGPGTYDIHYNIDFGSKTMGGPNSRVDGSASGFSGNFNIPLAERDFGELGGNGEIIYIGVPNGGGSCASCFGDVKIEFFNFNGEAAAGIQHEVKITESATIGQGSGIAVRQEGPTP